MCELSEKANDKDNDNVEGLKKDVEWLVNFGKKINKKIKNFFEGKNQKLKEYYYEEMINCEDENFKRFFESEQEKNPEIKKVRKKGNADD